MAAAFGDGLDATEFGVSVAAQAVGHGVDDIAAVGGHGRDEIGAAAVEVGGVAMQRKLTEAQFGSVEARDLDRLAFPARRNRR